MPRKPKIPVGPSRLSKILSELNRQPRPHLDTVKSLKLTYAWRNDHFGARYFAKEDLQRIRYVNPNMDIQVNKVPKAPQERWQPEMIVEFSNGTTRTISMDNKMSSAIFQELMDMAGGNPWEQWKKARLDTGLPIVDPPKHRASNTLKTPKASKKPHVDEILFDPTKTGAAAVLP